MNAVLWMMCGVKAPDCFGGVEIIQLPPLTASLSQIVGHYKSLTSNIAKYSVLLFPRLFSDLSAFPPLKHRKVLFQLYLNIHLHLK